MNENNYEKLTNSQYLLLYFFIYSFLGWLLETCYAIYELGHFTTRGFLYSPLCPIYGCGAIIILTFLNRYKNSSLKLFFTSAIVFSFFEYIVSYSLEAMFSTTWWDYSNEFFNLNGRISIFFSFVWGIIAILFIHNIHPFLEKKTKAIINKLPLLSINLVLKLLFMVATFDAFISAFHYLLKLR